MLTERKRALIDASDLCYAYSKSLAIEKREWSEVALECSAIIDDARKQGLTITEINEWPCQELFNFLQEPEIDYTSGFPR